MGFAFTELIFATSTSSFLHECKGRQKRFQQKQQKEAWERENPTFILTETTRKKLKPKTIDYKNKRAYCLRSPLLELLSIENVQQFHKPSQMVYSHCLEYQNSSTNNKSAFQQINLGQNAADHLKSFKNRKQVQTSIRR